MNDSATSPETGRPGLEEWIEFSFEGRDYSFVLRGRPDTIQSEIRKARRFYEQDELEFIRSFLPESARVVDVGANIGNHSIYFDRVCGAEVVAFEPNGAVLDELRANLKRNGCENVDTRFLGVALGAASGKGTLYLAEADRTTNNRGGTRLALQETGTVRIEPLDSFVQGPVDLVKIDVEGMALDVLRGAGGLLEGPKRPLLFVEVEDATKVGFEQWLKDSRYLSRAVFSMYYGIYNHFCMPVELFAPDALEAGGKKRGHVGDKDGSASKEVKAMVYGNGPVEPAALGLSPERYAELRSVFDVQSAVFATELMPSLWDLYPSGLHNFTMLDVGPRTAAGTALIQHVHHPRSFSRIKLKTYAIDKDPTFYDYARIHYPDVEYLVGDIFDYPFPHPFDIVVCSHTLEHLAEPLPFLEQLRKLATKWTIIACPFEEHDLSPGHVTSLSYEFFEAAGAHSLKVYRSLTWHQSLACIAVFSGAAST